MVAKLKRRPASEHKEQHSATRHCHRGYTFICVIYLLRLLQISKRPTESWMDEFSKDPCHAKTMIVSLYKNISPKSEKYLCNVKQYQHSFYGWKQQQTLRINSQKCGPQPSPAQHSTTAHLVLGSGWLPPRRPRCCGQLTLRGIFCLLVGSISINIKVNHTAAPQPPATR